MFDSVLDEWPSDEVLLDRVRSGDVPPDPPLPGEAPPSGFAAFELDLATADARGMSDAAVLDGVVGLDRVVSWAQARQARLLAEFLHRRGDAWEALHESRPSPISSYAPDEVGVALRISRGSAMARLHQARFLVETLPDVLHALERGLIDSSKVRAIVDAVCVLPPESAAAVAARVLPRAPEQSVAQLRAALAKAIIVVDPEGANDRHREARRERRITVTEQPEGMASLWALLSAPDARGVWEWLTRLARGLGADDPRGMDARRADLLVALLTGRITLDDTDTDTGTGTDDTGTDDTGTGTGAAATDDTGTGAAAAGAAATDVDASGCAGTGPSTESEPAADPAGSDPDRERPERERLRPVTPGKPLVHVIVPYPTLIGADDQPCELAGYGPIPADLAREVAADAVWRRLLIDPASGALLDHGRTTYHPPAALADHVRARDLYCRGPRCRRPATSSELDHHTPYPQGPTSEDNLWAGCKHDHDLKHHGGWRVALHSDGSLEWLTPTGYRYTSHPHDYRPHPDDLHPGGCRKAPRPPPPAEPDDDPPPF